MSLCLIMIVKNEAHCIERCLNSVKPLIDHWVIVDTGSTDGTQSKINQIMAGIPGTLYERPWHDFATNRSESIDLARDKAEYGFVIDADDCLQIKEGFQLPALDQPGYELRIEYGETIYYRPHIFKLSLPFKYVSVLHEYLCCEGVEMASLPRLEDGLVYKVAGGGSRSSDPKKFQRDADTLRRALLQEPKNSRYVFYLAQSLKDGGNLEKAVTQYERRSKMGGWDEEVWTSLYEAAILKERLRYNETSVVQAYLKAYELRPQRVDPLYRLAAYYRVVKDRPQVAYIYAAAGLGAIRPSDRLMMDETIYTWRLDYEYAIASYYANRRQESFATHKRLLENAALPTLERDRILKNLDCF